MPRAKKLHVFPCCTWLDADDKKGPKGQQNPKLEGASIPNPQGASCLPGGDAALGCVTRSHPTPGLCPSHLAHLTNQLLSFPEPTLHVLLLKQKRNS